MPKAKHVIEEKKHKSDGSSKKHKKTHKSKEHKKKEHKSKEKPAEEKKTESKPGLGVKRPRRHKPGFRARIEVRKQQRMTNLLLKKKPFSQIVREITLDIPGDGVNGNHEVRFALSAMSTLQELAESYLLDLFRLTMTNAAMHGKKRINAAHLDHVQMLRYPQIAKVED